MKDKKKSEEPRGRNAEKDDGEDSYTPAVLNEGPKRYRFEDWASI